MAAAIGAVSLVLAAAGSTPAAVVPLVTIEHSPNGVDQLGFPVAVATDPAGRVYVGDTGRSRISVFGPDGRFAYAFGWDVVAGNLEIGFEVCAALAQCTGGRPGSGAGQLDFLADLAVDQMGRLYVTELARVSVFDVSRPGEPRFLRAFGWDVVPDNANTGSEVCTATTRCQAGSTGGGAGQIAPTGIAVSSTGEVYVSEFSNNRISVFTVDGAFVHAFGVEVNPRADSDGFSVCTVATTCRASVPGSSAAQLAGPHGLARDRAGLLYVADLRNHRISVFDTASPTPSFVRAFGSGVLPGAGSLFEVCTEVTRCEAGVAGGRLGQLSNPIDLELDPQGVLAVLEFAGRRVTRFGNGAPVQTFGGDVVAGNLSTGFEVCGSDATCKLGASDFARGSLTEPQGMAVDCRGSIWVADPQVGVVQQYGEPGTPAAPCTAGGAPPPPPPPPPPPNLDRDADGVTLPRDCDDANPLIHPGARDKPGDRIDQDCDGRDAPYPLLVRGVDAFSSTYPRRRYTRFTSMVVLRVRRGDRLRLTCAGPGCRMRGTKVRVRRRAARLSLVRHLKGSRLRKGAVVRLRITRPATVGRVSTWRIRAPKVPRLERECLPPGATRPSACPR